MTLAPGTRLGRYEVRAPLGAGGMGEVYLAWDLDLEREVAIKVLAGSAAESSDRVRRFIQEARAASALHHPNVAHVYEIGSQDDLRFIAMEIVEGETLRRRLGRGEMSIEDVLSIGTQIAAALAAAHKHGIVHRDVKPENVIISQEGHAKVLDFGLAKLRELRGEDGATLLKTTPGVAMGTLGYMPPEQLSGGEIGPPADVFSLGVVLYEMVAGRRPFEGATGTEIATAILSKTPRSLFELRRDTPPKLEAVVAKALAKSADERYPTAAELFEELRQISRATMSAPAMPVARPGRSKRIMIVAAAIVIVVLAAAGVWWARRASRLRTGEVAINTAERLIKERRLAEAYETAVAAAAILPGNARLREVISQSSGRLSIESDPPGATVFLERFKGPAKRARAGVTPLTIPRLARADYVVTLEKVGYAPAVRPISTLPWYGSGDPRVFDTGPLRVKLIEASRVPPEMVFVGGGKYRLSGWSRLSDRAVELRDFLIDRYEVSNRDFREFVRDGGYRRRDLWKHPFVDGSRTLSFEEATARFRDTTGLPGPRGWTGGASPAGRENHPVTDVTWYEAAAFAEWKGKKLPTVYQWEKAGRYPLTRARGNSFPWGIVGEGVDATERANFLDKGTMAVDSMPFGVSPWGAYHMAGNVSEWCRNRNGTGFAERGGGWNEPVYAFGRTGAYPGFYSSATLGFRCVKETDGGGGDQGEFALSPSGFLPQYTPVDDHRYNQIRTRYEYAKEPLNARVVEVVQTADWKREKIAYSGGVDRTAFAYLYVPKGFRQRFQVIHFAPAGDVELGVRTLTASIEVNLAPLIRGGRAVFAVLREGYLGRPFPPGVEVPDSRTDEYVDFTITQVTELRRGVDYVQSRHDLDSSRIGFLGPSAGASAGVILTALETRYRSVMFIGTGIEPEEITDAPAANRINFAPRIAAPKLMLQGRYDEIAPLESTAKPMFRLLREPKRLDVFEGGHAAPLNVYVPKVTKWMDETLGPVAQ